MACNAPGSQKTFIFAQLKSLFSIMFVFVFQLFVLETHTVLMHKQTLPLCTYGSLTLVTIITQRTIRSQGCVCFVPSVICPNYPLPNRMPPIWPLSATRLVVAKQPLIKWFPVCVYERCKINFSVTVGLYSFFSSMFFLIHILHVIAPFAFNKYKF